MVVRNMQTMKCIKCGHIQPVIIETSKCSDDVERVHTRCNSCQDEVTCYYTDKDIRKLQAQQRLILSKPNMRNWNKVIEEKKKEIKKRMDKLKEKKEKIVKK